MFSLAVSDLGRLGATRSHILALSYREHVNMLIICLRNNFRLLMLLVFNITFDFILVSLLQALEVNKPALQVYLGDIFY